MPRTPRERAGLPLVEGFGKSLSRHDVFERVGVDVESFYHWKHKAPIWAIPGEPDPGARGFFGLRSEFDIKFYPVQLQRDIHRGWRLHLV